MIFIQIGAFMILLSIAGIGTDQYPGANSINEVIRRKIENLSTFRTVDRIYNIYCIPSVREVYISHDFEPFWEDETKINDLIREISHCDEEGLNPTDYHLEEILDLQGGTSIEETTDLDIILTDACLLYLSHMLTGKVNPFTIDSEWHVEKSDRDPLKYFYQIDSLGLSEVIRSITPQILNYALLKNRLSQYRQLTRKGEPGTIPDGEVLRPGMRDPRIPMIREIQAFYTGEIPSPQDPEIYDDTLREEIIRFQRLNGLEALGNIGPQTLMILNRTLEDRISCIEVNMERIRWLPLEFPEYYALVNIANFELHLIEDGQVIRIHNVVVGKPFRMTPVFSSTMQYIVINPTWTVPPTILREDLIPEIRKNNLALTQKNIKVYDQQGKPLDSDSVDWSGSEVFSYIYRQDPGKGNALGQVKFMFPNPFNVYLHDTPNKELFQRTERAFSSGCIRVQKPLELAEYLLRDQPEYSAREIRRIIESGVTKTVMLNSKPDVFLLYLTAWVDGNGEMNFRRDIYGRDKKLIEALDAIPEYDLTP